MKWLFFILLIIGGTYLVSVMERYFYENRLDFIAPFRSLFRMFLKEDVKPKDHDKIFYEAAPILFIIAVILAISVLPFGEDLVIIDMATGALFLNAALAYIMVAMLMAGWAPNGVYSLVSGWRFLGQLIAYSMPIVMTITAAVMRAESISLIKIIESQQSLWNIIYQPIGFILFYLSAMALAFIPPFDLPVAKGELAGGSWAEFTGVRFMLFRVGRLMLVFTLSLAVVILFLGGWLGPWLPGYLWIIIKTLVVVASFFAVGRIITRIQHDILLSWSWKYATPAALFNIFYVGVILLL